MSREEDLEKLKALQEGEYAYINWFEGGGGEVTKVNNIYFLDEIAAYGGPTLSTELFKEDELDQLLDLAYSWT